MKFTIAASFLAVSLSVHMADAKTTVGVYGQENMNGSGKGDCSDETWNLVSIVDHFVATEGAAGEAFEDFVADKTLVLDFTDEALKEKIETFTFFFMPDMERSVTGWDARAQGIVKDYVAGGGNLVMTGTHGTSDVNFLNSAFPGWDVSSAPCSTIGINSETSKGTPWESDSSSLSCPSATEHLNCGTVECHPIWGTKHDAAVAVLPYGEGLVVYLGFDYFNTGYPIDHVASMCGQATDPWVTEAFRGSLLFAKAIATGEIVFEDGETTTTDRTHEETTGKASGDPHFQTWSGGKYDFHGECDLVLMENDEFHNGLGLRVHIRTQIHTWWSSIQSAAVHLGEYTLEIAGDNGDHKISYWLNGAGPVELESSHAALGDYDVSFRRVNEHQSQTRVDLGNGDALSIETFKDFVRVNVVVKDDTKFNGSHGLLGNFPTGQKLGRDGATVFADSNEFGEEWRVVASDPQLFHTESAHPLKCLMPDQTTKKAQRRLGESAITTEDAAGACARVPEVDRDACIFDVLATNDKEMAGSY